MRNVTILLAVVAVLAMAVPSYGGWTDWKGNTGSWFLAGNWTDGVPDSTDDAYLLDGGEAQISSGAARCNILNMTAADVRMTGGTLTTGGTAGALRMGGGTGTVTFFQEGGDVWVKADTHIGRDAAGYGIYAISGGDFLVGASATIGREIRVGWYGPGELKVIGNWSDTEGIISFGSYRQHSSNGKLTVEVQSDGIKEIQLGGAAYLAGTLNVIDNGAPADTYTLMTYGSCSTTFGTVTKPANGLWGDPVYGAHALTITKVPEPATLALLGLGGLGVLIRRRRR